MNIHATVLLAFRAVLVCGLLVPSVLMANTHEHDVVLDTDGLATQLDFKSVHGDADNSPLQINFSAMGFDLTLILHRSNVTRAIELPYSLSLWQGHVEGHDDSWARISISQGTPEGSLYFNSQLYQLVAHAGVEQHTEMFAESDTMRWVLIEPGASSKSLTLQQQFESDVDMIMFPPASTHTTPTVQAPQPSVFDRRALSDNNGIAIPVTRAMRIGVVIDSRFNAIHGGRGLAKALAIINELDGLYQQQLGIAVLIEHTRVFDDADTDPMRNVSGEVATMLKTFRDVRLDDPGLPRSLSLVHLFTGNRDPANIIGLGWIGSICRLDGYDVSISTPFPFGALLAAHEIAHNLGAPHDDDEKCLELNGNARDQIMWPKITGATKPGFSQCSTRHMRAALTASCNIDNIDMAIQLQSRPGNSSMERTVYVYVDNKDTVRNAPGIRSRTAFSEGTVLTSPSAGCSVNGLELLCNHGTVTTLGSTVSVVAKVADVSNQQAIATLELSAISDVYTLDNRANLQILQFDPQSGDAVFAVSSNATGGSAGQASDVINLGLLSFIEWLLLSMAIAWRGRMRVSNPMKR